MSNWEDVNEWIDWNVVGNLTDEQVVMLAKILENVK